MKIALGEIATYINGYAFKPEDRGKHGLPIIRIQDLTGNGYDLAYYDGKYPEKIEINNGDILISWSASLGVYKWNRGKALLNQHIFKVVFDKKPIDKQYFVFATEYHLREMEQQTHGATMKHITKSAFEKIEIPYPKLEKQKKIANKLERTKSLLLKQHREIELLDQLLKARFVEMFGNIGQDNKGWRLTTLGKACIINPHRSKDINTNLEYSFVPMPSVSEHGSIDASECKQYDEVKNGYTYFQENDVLFAKITPCMENGKGAVAQGLKNGIGFGSTEFHILRPIDGISNPYWLYEITMQPQFRIFAERHMTGSGGQRRVPASFLKNFPISIPPLDLQNHYADFFQQVDKSKAAIQKSIDETQLLYDSLMQKYFG